MCPAERQTATRAEGRTRLLCLALLPALLALVVARPGGDGASRAHRPALPEPERRAVAFLAREVPRWSVENRCFSCHNNGDAARALYAAGRLAGAVPAGVLDVTTRWLGRPDSWEHNGGEGPFNDPILARVQFAAALLAAMEAGEWRDRSALVRAADLVLEYQEPDGTWATDAGDGVGSPAAYGRSLSVALMRRVLLRADPRRYRKEIARVDSWVRKKEAANVFDAAAVLLALGEAQDAAAESQRRHCLEVIRKGQAKEGGWGPYSDAPPEPFDTAVVLLALAELGGRPEIDRMRRRGRAWLVSVQRKDGSWQETTRPPGVESYAQRLSTTGWATLALLATPPP